VENIAGLVLRDGVAGVDLVVDVRGEIPAIFQIREHQIGLKGPPWCADIAEPVDARDRAVGHIMPKPAFTKTPLSPSLQLNSAGTMKVLYMPAGHPTERLDRSVPNRVAIWRP
jgi:hypothetical protein